MSDPNPTGWLPAEEAPELAPPPPEILVPGADLDLVAAPLAADPVAPVIGEDLDRGPAALGVEPEPESEPGPVPVEEEEITPEMLAALPVELLGIAPRTVLSPGPFVAWGFGLGVVALVLALIPPVWWMFGLVFGATALRVGWTAWARSTGSYSGSRTRAVAVLVLAGLALAVALIAAVRFFATMSQITVG